MIDVTNPIAHKAIVLDAIVRATVANTIGISTGVYGSIVHLSDLATPTEQMTVQQIINNFGELAVNANKITMSEGDADPIVTCADPRIAGDAALTYIVTLDGGIYASGTADVTAGLAELTLIAPVAGVYEIFVFRASGDYASGSITITVVEA